MYSLFFFVYLYFQSENIAVTCPKRTWEFRKKTIVVLSFIVFSPSEMMFFFVSHKKTRKPPDPQLMLYVPLARSFFALQKTDAPIFFLYYPLNAISLKLVVGTYGQSHSSVHLKNILEVFFWLSFHSIPSFNSNYEKSANAILLSNGTNYFPSSQNIDKSVSTQQC